MAATIKILNRSYEAGAFTTASAKSRCNQSVPGRRIGHSQGSFLNVGDYQKMVN